MVRRLAAVLCAALVVSMPASASADWRRTSELNYNTAFTLDQGMLEIGVITPLSIGVTDEFQVAIHPILLLLGAPYLAFRWRLTHKRDVSIALNLSGSWSFIRREDDSGQPSGDDTREGEDVGFPGTVQLTGTITFRAGERLLLSVGGGPALDWLSANPIRGMAEVHAGLHWLISDELLAMMQASTYLDPRATQPLRRPLAQVMIAWAASNIVHIGVGVGFGEFIFEESDTDRQTLNVFPLADIWFRF